MKCCQSVRLNQQQVFSFYNKFIFLISGPPEITTAYLERYVAQEGDTVKLVCPIIGTPRPIIEWYQVYISDT